MFLIFASNFFEFSVWKAICGKLIFCLFRKDAGFVYESLRIETNRVIWDFCFHETNPRYESLRFGFANPDSQIWNFRIRKDSDSRISIFKDSFRAIVLRICWIRKNGRIFENWLDSWLTIQNEYFKVRIRDPRYETNLFEVRIRSYDTVRIHVFTNLLYESRILTFSASFERYHQYKIK